MYFWTTKAELLPNNLFHELGKFTWEECDELIERGEEGYATPAVEGGWFVDPDVVTGSSSLEFLRIRVFHGRRLLRLGVERLEVLLDVVDLLLQFRFHILRAYGVVAHVVHEELLQLVLKELIPHIHDECDGSEIE